MWFADIVCFTKQAFVAYGGPNIGVYIIKIIIPQKSFSYIKLLWINELFITFPGKMNY